MNVRDVMRYESDAILAEWRASCEQREDILPYAGVPDPEELTKTPTRLRAAHPVQLVPLPDQDQKMAFVQVCPSLKYKFLWAHMDNTAYRDDYGRFLKIFHGVTEELPKGIVADHLYNRARARVFGTPYVRMMLAEAPINSSLGGGYERLRTGGVGTVGNQRPIDTVLLLKINGMPSPKKGKSLTAEMIGHIQRVSALYGIPFDDLVDDVKRLMEVAVFRPRK